MKSKYALGLLTFLVLLHEHLWYIFLGFGYTLNDLHPFRQTQTALTAYYLKASGFRLDYLTPVVGYPWSIPFEFPFYQWIAVGMHQLFALELNVSGRLVSIAALYLVLVAVFLFLGSLSLSKLQRFVILSAILLNPTLLFWSRTFMIESTALLLSVLYLLATFKVLTLYKARGNISYPWLTMAWLIGSLAALTKVTTFIVYLFCSGLFLLYTVYENRRNKKLSSHLREGFIYALCAYIVPVLLAFIWTRYTDQVKQLSYIGSKLTSASLQGWNFGSLTTKFSLDTWGVIDNNCCHYLGIAVGITLLSHLFSLRYRVMMLIFTLSGLSGPLLFTNLYKVHDYYSAANTLLFSLTIGLFALAIIELKGRKLIAIPAAVLIASICWVSITSYFDRYFGVQSYNNDRMQLVGLEIKRLTGPDDVLLVIGKDWSSEIAYYSERKAVCIPDWMLAELNGNVDAFLEKFKTSKVTAFAAVEHRAKLDSMNLKIVRHYGLSDSPYQLAGGYCYLFLKKQ